MKYQTIVEVPEGMARPAMLGISLGNEGILDYIFYDLLDERYDPVMGTILKKIRVAISFETEESA